MPEKETEDHEEKINRLLVMQANVLPDEFEALQQFLKTTRHMLKFYFGESGLHFEEPLQKKMEALVMQSDLLVLSFNRLRFQAREWADTAHKKLLAKQPFQIDAAQTGEFQKAFVQLKKNTRALASDTQALVNELRQLQEKQ